MKLSIVIPLYNKEKYIDRCVKSLLNQDLIPNEYEIIIIDDGSTDSSCSIAQVFAKKNKNVHLFSQENKGLSATRNRGLEIAKGDYIYFLDADDYIASNVLKCLTELSEENELNILGFDMKYVSDDDDSFTDSLTQNLQDLSVQVMDGITFIGERGYRNEVWWYIIKKSFLLDTGIKFIDGRFAQDSPFTSNLFAKANRVARIKLDVHRFVKVENSVQTSTDNAHLLKYIYDFVFAIEELGLLIKNIDNSHKSYEKAVRNFKQKQQSFVFSLFIKVFRCDILKFDELKKILVKLKKMDTYPINPKIGGIGGSKTSLIYNMTVVPIINNKTLLFLGLRIKRIISSR